MTTPQYTFSCLIHSRFPGQFRSPVRLHWLFFPLSTRVYQAHAEGRGCLPFTREAGVAPPPFGGVVAIPPSFCGIIDLHGYAVTKIKTTFAAQPPPLRVVSGEQVAHTDSSGQR